MGYIVIHCYYKYNWTSDMSNDWIPVDFTKPPEDWPDCLFKEGYFEVYIQGIYPRVLIDHWYQSEFLSKINDYRSNITHIKPITLSEPPPRL